ncbi:sugar transporter [Methylibium sp. Pch-M]|jgi:TRAP-type mannitol/chloroaromatic compound transport system permease small subunit|uniref:TRAP transporter small permease subunit n=1 Tax=Methylibium sp. Pch-M TaxID=2082386 RepID=UPI0010129D37|nr:TRAP transporter small permease subunit [Methylibium sp. Pch-M]QAZ38640.1 sugar transporter [Methylibium sp. Pch-M]
MSALSRIVSPIDVLNDCFAWLAQWAVLACCLISAGNALVRYGLDYSSNAWLEIQWYLFAACVMLGASQVLRLNEHVRVDVFYGRLSGRGKVFVDLFGLVAFLMPVVLLMLWLSLPLFWRTYTSGEMSGNAGGLIRWPAMLMLPLGFALLALQGLAEIAKRIGWLLHRHEMHTHYERPLQ